MNDQGLRVTVNHIANGTGQGFGFHYHAIAAPVGPVIGYPMATGCMVPDIQDIRIDQSPVNGPSNDSVFEKAGEHIRKNGQNRKFHGHSDKKTGPEKAGI
jgi:hypothetical protein